MSPLFSSELDRNICDSLKGSIILHDVEHKKRRAFKTPAFLGLIDGRNLEVELWVLVGAVLFVYLNAAAQSVTYQQSVVGLVECAGHRHAEVVLHFGGLDPAPGLVHVGIGFDRQLCPF